MSLTRDGFWKAAFWAPEFWADGFWQENAATVVVVPVPAASDTFFLPQVSIVAVDKFRIKRKRLISRALLLG